MSATSVLITPTVTTVTPIQLGGSLNTLVVTNESVTPDQILYVFLDTIGAADRAGNAYRLDAGESLIVRAEDTSHLESGYTGKISTDTIRLVGGGGAGAGLGVGTFGGGAGAAFLATVIWTVKPSASMSMRMGRAMVEQG